GADSALLRGHALRGHCRDDALAVEYGEEPYSTREGAPGAGLEQSGRGTIVDCLEVANKWLLGEFREDLELMRHVAECTGCARMARGLTRVDTLVAAAVVVAPPLDLQRRLSQLVIESTQPAPLPWYRQIVQFDFSNLLARPQMVAVQGLAALLL